MQLEHYALIIRIRIRKKAIRYFRIFETNEIFRNNQMLITVLRLLKKRYQKLSEVRQRQEFSKQRWNNMGNARFLFFSLAAETYMITWDCGL